MAITDHIAILTHHALAAAQPNKKKQGRMEFYVLAAFPPTAIGDLGALVQAVYPGANISQISVNLKTNAQQAKPIPGVPSDWYIVRAATQFAPYLADETGKQIIDPNVVRAAFFAGMKVRVSLSAFSWTQDGVPGASFNVNGVMLAGQGERLAIGNGATANAFAGYANPNATPAAVPGQNAQTVATPNTGNPFGGAQQVQAAQHAQSANPFNQSAPAGNVNPFNQSA